MHVQLYTVYNMFVCNRIATKVYRLQAMSVHVDDDRVA